VPDSFKIDAHVHVFTTDMPLIDNPRHAPTWSFTHEQLIATLDENGVDRAVIAAASPWGDYNDYMLAAVRAHPERLRATAIFRRPMERFELEAMGREGFVGVRLPFIGLPALPDITTFDYRALFRRRVAQRGRTHAHDRERSTLTQAAFDHAPHQHAARRCGHHFRRRASRVTSFSSSDSASNFFNRVFSVSSSFRRFASETLMPPNLLRQR